jgi:flagellar motor switch protein FliN
MAEELKNPEVPEFKGEIQTPPSVQRDINFILDVPLELMVVIGSTKILIQELLQLGQGSVIALDKLAGEPMEVYVNQMLGVQRTAYRVALATCSHIKSRSSFFVVNAVRRTQNAVRGFRWD